jgi:hypothetical protein
MAMRGGDMSDVTSRGIDEEVMIAIVEDAVVSRFGPA